jgi:hypothetical protein
MLSPNNPRSKLSRVAKISIKPFRGEKLTLVKAQVMLFQINKSYAHTNNPSHKQSQTTMLGSTNASSHEEHAQSQNNNPNLITNASLDAHSTKTPSTHEAYLPSISCFHDYSSSNLSPPPRVSPPHPITSHAIPMLHVQLSILNNNHIPPSSPSSKHLKFIEELKEAHELYALLTLHLAQ